MAEMLSQSTLTAVYVASIVGGVFVVLSAICLGFFIRSRRRMARRRRLQEELAATAKPRRQIFLQQEIEIPAGMAERFKRKDDYIRATLGDAYPMHQPLPRAHLADRSYVSLDAVVTPQRTPTIISRLSGNKLKMAVDWMKPRPLPKPGQLKNQASKPNLAPRKLVKHNHQSSEELIRTRKHMSA